jgi:hypothetical protein
VRLELGRWQEFTENSCLVKKCVEESFRRPIQRMEFIDRIGLFLVVVVREKSTFEKWGKGSIERSTRPPRFHFECVSRELRKAPRTTA